MTTTPPEPALAPTIYLSRSQRYELARDIPIWRITMLTARPNGDLGVTIEDDDRRTEEILLAPKRRPAPPPAPPTDITAAQLCAGLNDCLKPPHTYRPWCVKNADKAHADAFGDLVQAGEYYLVRQEGGAHHADRKLSLRSARTIWEIILTDNGKEAAFRKHLEEQAEADQAPIRAAQENAAQCLDA